MDSIVHHRAVIPHKQITRLPAMSSLILWSCALFKQCFKQPLAFASAPPVKSLCESATDIQGLFTGFIVASNNRMLLLHGYTATQLRPSAPIYTAYGVRMFSCGNRRLAARAPTHRLTSALGTPIGETGGSCAAVSYKGPTQKALFSHEQCSPSFCSTCRS